MNTIKRVVLILLFINSLFNPLFSQYTSIPDPNFEQALIDFDIDTDGQVNGQILTSDASSASYLDFASRNISDLTGLQDFLSVEVIQMSGNNISSFDGAGLFNLRDLLLTQNPLISISLTDNALLETLVLGKCMLSTLDVTNNSSLIKLTARENSLVDIDLSNNANLEILDLDKNELQSLNISQQVNLTNLRFYENNIQTIDFSNNTNLRQLVFGANQITSIDVSNNILLEQFSYFGEPGSVTSIDISNNVNLWDFSIQDNDLTEIDISNNVNLVEVVVSGNNLTSLDVTNNLKLEKIHANRNNFTSFPIGVENLDDLRWLYLAYNNISGCWPEELSSICGLPIYSFHANVYDGVNNFISDQGYLDFCNDQSGECCFHLDYPALAAFYNSLGGDNWTNNTGWMSNCDPCGLDPGNDPWYGLTCELNAVTEIELFSNNLSGTIPEELFEIQSLKRLELTNNDIGGIIPDYFCAMPQLQDILLGDNSLTGTIPSCIEDMIFLHIFYCYENLLTGELPNFGSQNDQLIQFWAHGNSLQENIPASYAEVPSFTPGSPSSLKLQDNNLSGDYAPELIALCGANLPNSHMSDENSFTEAWVDFCNEECAFVPDDNFELALQALGYDSGPLDDCVAISNIDNVVILDVSGQSIEDLKGIEFFTSLEYLDCSNNDIVFINVNENTALTCLNAADNMINCLNLGFDNLPNMNEFNVANNNIAGCWPEQMEDLCSLATYNFDGNYYDGTSNFISNAGWLNYCSSGIGACESTWDGYSALNNGLSSWVQDLTIDNNGNVYAGGYFTSSGGQALSRVAKWDVVNEQWIQLGSGITYIVEAVQSDNLGNIYAGGRFNQAIGGNFNYVSKWNASTNTWISLDNGMNREVFALEVDDQNNIYAGGWFTLAGGNNCRYIAMWDQINFEWKNLGSGSPQPILDIEFDQQHNLIYVAMRRGVARYDRISETWNTIGSSNANVESLSLDDSGNLYIAGRFTTIGGINASKVAMWSRANQQWHSLNAGTNSEVFAVNYNQNGKVYFGGGFNLVDNLSINRIAEWDPVTTEWSNLGTGISWYVKSIINGTDGDLFIGGGFRQSGSIYTPCISQYQTCKPDMIITCEIPAGSYVAGEQISTTAPVINLDDVTLSAPEVILQPGFSVESASFFEVNNDGCN